MMEGKVQIRIQRLEVRIRITDGVWKLNLYEVNWFDVSSANQIKL